MFTVGNFDRYINRYIGRHSINIAVNSQSPVDRLLINSWLTINRLSTDWRSRGGRLLIDRAINHRPIFSSTHLDRISVICRCYISQLSLICRWPEKLCRPTYILTDYRPTIDWVATESQSSVDRQPTEWRSSIDRYVDRYNVRYSSQHYLQ